MTEGKHVTYDRYVVLSQLTYSPSVIPPIRYAHGLFNVDVARS